MLNLFQHFRYHPPQTEAHEIALAIAKLSNYNLLNGAEEL